MCVCGCLEGGGLKESCVFCEYAVKVYLCAGMYNIESPSDVYVCVL